MKRVSLARLTVILAVLFVCLLGARTAVGEPDPPVDAWKGELVTPPFEIVVATATTEEVTEKIAKAEADMTSYEGDLIVVVKPPTGGTELMTFHLAVEFSVNDGKPVVRRMYKKEEVRQADGKTRTERWVDDGESRWIEIRWPASGAISVHKQKTGTSGAGEVYMARDMRKQFDVKLTAEDALDGEKTWVLEGPLRGKSKTSSGEKWAEKIRMFIRQDDGMARRLLVYGKDDKEIMKAQFSHVKVNRPIDPTLFKYAPPEGVKVNDRTKAAFSTPKDKTEKDDEKKNEGDEE